MNRGQRQGAILVLGGSGQLGTALARLLARSEASFLAPAPDRLDLTRLDEIEADVSALAPSAVINAAAFTDVAAAENPERRGEVDLLNRDAPGELGRTCRRLGVPLVHVSTDYVFDGKATRPYRESDPTAPLQVYGRSKLEGEHAVLQAFPDGLVVRTSTLFGESECGRSNYVKAVMRQARETGRFDVVRLPVSSPTYAPDLAAAILDLLQRSATGLVHAANAGACSRLELAREIAEIASPGGAQHVGERPEPEGGLARPNYSVLDTTRMAALTGRSMRPWSEGLRAYIRDAGL